LARPVGQGSSHVWRKEYRSPFALRIVRREHITGSWKHLAISSDVLYGRRRCVVGPKNERKRLGHHRHEESWTGRDGVAGLKFITICFLIFGYPRADVEHCLLQSGNSERRIRYKSASHPRWSRINNVSPFYQMIPDSIIKPITFPS
jgi:hypothetical protein